MKSTTFKLLRIFLATCMITTLFATTTVLAATPSLLITEICPDTDSGDDYYEFIEIYNNSDSAINTANYSINYNGTQIYNLESSIIASKTLFVVWVSTDLNTNKTKDDFKAYCYAHSGIRLLDSQIKKTTSICDGMANAATRTLVLKNGASTVCSATYTSNSTPNKGYMYNYSSSQTMTFDVKADCSPGAILATRVPADTTAPAAPTLTLAQSQPTSGSSMITINYSDDSMVRQYKVGANGTYVDYTAPIIQPYAETIYAKSQDASGNWSNEASIQSHPDFTPTLLITEVMPNNAGDDYYEYMEIYNNSESIIDLSGYSIDYLAGATTYTFSFGSDSIAPKSLAVVWLKAPGNTKTKTDFIAYALKQATKIRLLDSQVVIVPTEGLVSNTDERTFLIRKTSDSSIVSRATYDPDDTEDYGYMFKYVDAATMEFTDKSVYSPGCIATFRVPADTTAPVDPTLEVSTIESSNSTKLVSISYSADSMVRQYKIGATGTYADYTGSIVSYVGDTVYAKSQDASGNWSREATVAITASTADFNTLPTLMITEVAPDTTNLTNLDGYEFVELYNNSNLSINLKNYKFRYILDNTTTTDWDINQDYVLAPQSVAVVWVTNEENKSKSISDFIAYAKSLNITLSEDKVLRAPDTSASVLGGLYNPNSSVLKLMTDSDTLVCEVSYQNADVTNISCKYQYPFIGGKTMISVDNYGTATPGILNANLKQIPAQPVFLGYGVSLNIDSVDESVTDKVTVNCSVHYSGVYNDNHTVVIALYSSSGNRLLGVSETTLPSCNLAVKNINETFDIMNDQKSSYKVKAIIMDNMENMKPLAIPCSRNALY